MVVGLDIYLPNVVTRTIDEVFDGEHCRVHGMVLIVVAVHSVTANRVNIASALSKPAAQRVDIFFVEGVVHRVRLGHPYYVTLLNAGGVEQTESRHFSGSQGYEVVVASDPEFITFVHEELKAQTCFARFGNHLR